MRMGLDPDETQLAVYRAAIQTFDRNMVQQEYYDSLRESGMLSGMRADTLRDNGLENLTVLLKNENTVTLVAGYHTTAGSGWRPLEVELPLTPAAPAKRRCLPIPTEAFGAAGRRHPHRYHQTHPRDHRMQRIMISVWTACHPAHPQRLS